MTGAATASAADEAAGLAQALSVFKLEARGVQPAARLPRDAGSGLR